MKEHIEKIDLYLGSDLGLWTLDQISRDCVKQVITLEDQISSRAHMKDIKVILGNANGVDFEPTGVGLSVHYPKILRQNLLSCYRKIYNLHPGFLPWGRGYYPVFWALWEDTPAGATLHEIVADVDEGPIVDQIQVEHYPYDTGFSLFTRVRDAEKRLFTEYCKRIVEGEDLPAARQPSGGNYHTKREFFNLKNPENWQSMTSAKLFKLIRCFSFPGYTGLEIYSGGKKFSLSVEMINGV